MVVGPQRMERLVWDRTSRGKLLDPVDRPAHGGPAGRELLLPLPLLLLQTATIEIDQCWDCCATSVPNAMAARIESRSRCAMPVWLRTSYRSLSIDGSLAEQATAPVPRRAARTVRRRTWSAIRQRTHLGLTSMGRMTKRKIWIGLHNRELKVHSARTTPTVISRTGGMTPKQRSGMRM